MNNDRIREKKKFETKQALAESAFQLAKEHGVEEFIVEDIVKKAGYSRRTFANYFSCKEEAIASAFSLNNTPLEFRSIIATKNLGPVEAIELFIKHQFSLNTLNRLHELVCLSHGHSTLRLYVNAALHDVQHYAKQGLQEAYGSAYPPSYYHLLLGAVFGALLPLFENEMSIDFPLTDQDTESQFSSYIDDIFTQLRSGFHDQKGDN